MHVEVIGTEELGNRSYVIHDGSAAVVVDPQRDVDRVHRVLAATGVELGLVAETHIHNDYVTGGYDLASRAGVPYAVNAADPVCFDRLAVHHGDTLSVGSLNVSVVHTPGHTATHLAYVISDDTRPAEPPAVFTGGSLLYGTVGRTDLVDPTRSREFAQAQYRSARVLGGLLPDDALVFPTHGFGSFCSSTATVGQERISTLGREKCRNSVFVAHREDDFVENLVTGLTGYPAYYTHMAPRNLAGPNALDLPAPAEVDADELAKRIAAGDWVIDLRDRIAYAADHVLGTVSIELSGALATYVGWLVPWGSAVCLVGESADDIAEAQRKLSRIGIDELAGATYGQPTEIAGDEQRRNYDRTDFAAARRKFAATDVLLDVRRDDERHDEHIEGSLHVPIHELLARFDEIPPGRVWVYCASGYRAGTAASLLERAGYDVVHIDDDHGNAAQAGWRVR